MGWGAFPLVNGDFKINEGKYKVPLMHGEIDYNIDAFKSIEGKYRRNVDEWLANCYMEIKKIQLHDFKEYESKIYFSSKIKRKKTLKDKARRLLFGFGNK